MKIIWRRIALLVVLSSICARGADKWGHLKSGMSALETVAVLGQSVRLLVQSSPLGNGFECWIYDRGAEVVFYGGVIAWTVPSNSTAPSSTGEHWQFNQASPGEVVLPFTSRQKYLHPAPEQPPVPPTATRTVFRFLPH